MNIAFDVLVAAFVLVSLIMVVSVPVAYASSSSEGGNSGVVAGSIAWVILLILVSVSSIFVI